MSHLSNLDDSKHLSKLIYCSLCNYEVVPKIGICQICRNSQLTKITDRLYLTNYDHAKKYTKLLEYGIKQILTVGNEMDHATEELKTKYILIDDHGLENIIQHFEEAHEFINQDVTVVHCFAGISRSPTIVIAYLMKEFNMTRDAALQFCQEKRSIVNPNFGFRKQLLEYEKQLKIKKK